MAHRHCMLGAWSLVGSLAAAGALLGTCPAGFGETITVTIATDDVDIDWQTGVVDDLPGPDGRVSFSEALIASNNTPGRQTIGFAIPESDWPLQFAYPGRAVLTTITGYFWRASDEVTIDGTTQTLYTGDTNPDGAEVTLYGSTLYLNADNCTLLGLDSSQVDASGSNTLIEDNTGAMNITLFGGTGSLIRNNHGGTIKIDRSSHNVVVGNTVSRVRVLGFVGGGLPASNNRIGGPNPEDRNNITGYGTWNSEGLPSGTTVQIFDTVGTTIQNNWIGTTPDGMEQGSLASTIGIGFEGENFVSVVKDNRIAGILGEGRGPHHDGELYGWAILMQGSGSDFTIQGNTIGLNAIDEPVLGSVTGIDVGSFNYAGFTDVAIGHSLIGDGNVIAGHRFNGITVGPSVPRVRISRNSIFANDGLGIDLVPDGFGYGVSPNDPFDADQGGNGVQNFPELDSAVQQGGSLTVAGSLHSSVNDVFTIEFFASPECDDSGYGEGRIYLGETEVATNGSGDADFTTNIAASTPAGWIITATATREPLGVTSEFSSCATVTGDGLPGDLDGDGDVDQADLGILLSCYGTSDCGDLDGDGDTDQADLGTLLANYGSR